MVQRAFCKVLEYKAVSYGSACARHILAPFMRMLKRGSMKNIYQHLSFAVLVLGLSLSLESKAIPQYDSLVMYKEQAVLGELNAVNPGEFYFVDYNGVANPYIVNQVVLYSPDADLNATFVADIFGVAELAPDPQNPQIKNPYLFLISDYVVVGGWQKTYPGVLVEDRQMTYDATGFLNPDIAAAGVTLQFEHGVAHVPDAGSTLALLIFGLAGVFGLLRRK